ncbi:MAG: hypothetical protein Q9M25_02855 [Mariprofundaceae bacterium]|nr:hypothetical protein [Mariprofundaceae bacterium]
MTQSDGVASSSPENAGSKTDVTETPVLAADCSRRAELNVTAPPPEVADSGEIYTKDVAQENSGKDNIAGHSRREWLLLGERVVSHPRYAILIVAALALCAFEKYALVLGFLVVFFSGELTLRLWLQKERGFANKSELGFLLLDALATVSLIFAVLIPTSLLGSGMYLRLARLMRGMYMLRMLRIFRFFTYETFVYSMPFAVSVLILTCLAVLIPDMALYAGIVLLMETVCRAVAVLQTLEKGARRNAELAFVSLDMVVCISLLGIIPGLSPFWALLRMGRFLIMLNPLSNLLQALKGVAGRDEVRKESAMLMGVFALLMALTSLAVLYLYPQMDLSGDNGMAAADYAPWQVILYSFRFLLDPGNAPADAFSPLLALSTMGIVLAGVFFFALFVGLGANVMHYLLEQLANSPLSARESLLFAGWSEQALPILKVFDRMCARMRRSFASAWIFFGPVASGARSIGRWLAVRHADSGERDIMRRFHLSGVRFTFLFQSLFAGWRDRAAIADLHAMMREGAVAGKNTGTTATTRGMVICDTALPEDVLAVYRDSLAMDVLDSASLKARMLYQMHHCAHMPELGTHMFDAVNGETGLYAVAWELTIKADAASSYISDGQQQLRLEDWLAFCFARGVNLLAGRCEDGCFVLFSDLRQLENDIIITDVLGLGSEPSTWPTLMRSAMHAPTPEPNSQNTPLKAFNWPETWDLSMIFLGWHEGLPAMMEEMAEKHHKLSIHVLCPGQADVLKQRQARMQAAVERAEQRTACEMEAQVNPWYGFNAEALMPLLKGCKVIMLYPEEASGGEDSLLEMWFHEVARMLDARKAKVKWWTPPKLMVLPRDAAMIEGLRDVARSYERLAIDVGSPDFFHDVFMARQLLSRALYHARPDMLRQQKVAFDFMQTVLGDAVIIEDVDVERLLASSDADWTQVYREAWRRGWMLTAYLLPDKQSAGAVFQALETLFPHGKQTRGSRMHLLAGSQIEEMDMPFNAAKMLFCRRGLLAETGEDAAVQVMSEMPVQEEENIEKTAKEKSIAKDLPTSADKQKTVNGDDDAVDDSSGDKTAKNGPIVAESVESSVNKAASDAVENNMAEGTAGKPCEADQHETRLASETAKEGEVMSQSVWPQTADKRLLTVLHKQVAGALDLLNVSTEDGLIKLTDAMDRDVEGVLADDIMAALTDFQSIDRVMQRLRNVEACLSDWAIAQHAQAPAEVLWKDEVEKRYVMEEERQVLRDEL